jgi:predicted phage terminase large subunit-like protein
MTVFLLIIIGSVFMTTLERNIELIDRLHTMDMTKLKNVSMLYDMAIAIREEDPDRAVEEMKFVKQQAAVLTRTDHDAVELYWNAMLYLAQNRDLDSYLIYLERYREPSQRFYLPRRKQFLKLGIIQALQDLIDDKIDILTLSCPPGSGKTTLGEMFLSAWVGWDPDACNLFSSHSGHVTRMVYDVLNNIIGTDLKNGQIAEYAWREIFPTVEVQDVNAKEETINLGKFKAFKSITCRAVSASQTGVTRADGILYCDDLCSGIEEALSKIRLDKLWQKYTTDLKTRKKGGRHGRVVKELHIATRWSVWDVIGRLQRQYGNDERCRFLAFPDIDPKTGESNFEYEYGVGFDRKYFEDIEQALDVVTYKCMFKNEPIEREGLLYDPDMLRRFKELPPDKEPDAIWAFLDPKGTGTDYNALGVFFQYGQDYYLQDVVFRNIDPYLLDDLNADCLVRNNVQVCQVESNKEGVRTGDIVQEKIKELGGRCVVEKKFATANKETRIIVCSAWVIQHVLFQEPKSVDNPYGYVANSEYGTFMSQLTSYSQLSKNTHDDAPDMVTMLAIHEGGGNESQVATLYGNLF